MRPSSSCPARGLLALLPLLVVACGTVGTRSGSRRANIDKPWVVVGLAHDVDSRAPVVGELVRELSSRARVEVVKAIDRAKVRTAESAVKRALARGRKLYLRMQMEDAAEKFENALERVRATFAKELTSKDLAQIHLHLAAVRYAKQRMQLFHRHCRAAAGYDPTLSPNADLFSPPVRRCIKKARANLVQHEVTLVVHPADAMVILDGVPRKHGEALGSQFAGEHFLRVEHPLYQTWGRVLHLSAKAHLEVKLRPVSPPVMVSAVLERAPLAKVALPLLGAQALVLLDKKGSSITMRTVGPQKELWRTLVPTTPSAVLASSAEGVVRVAGRSPKARKIGSRLRVVATQPSSRPVAKASLWRSPWLWGAVTAGVLVAVIVPLAVAGDEEGAVVDPGTGRPVRLELPW